MFVMTRVLWQTGSYIQVFNFQEGTLHSVIDSHGARLKRPTGIRLSVYIM